MTQAATAQVIARTASCECVSSTARLRCLLLFLATWLISAEPLAEPVYRALPQQKSILSIEAEKFSSQQSSSLSHRWQVVTDTTSSADQVAQVLPDKGKRYTSSIETKSARLDYKLRFPSTGTWYVWVRGRALNGDSNSVHIGLDHRLSSTTRSIGSFPTGSAFGWIRKGIGGNARLQVGSTTTRVLNLWMDEDGVVVDKIVLTRSSSFVPIEHGPAVSPTASPPGYPVTRDSVVHAWKFDENPAYGKAVDHVRKAVMRCSACPSRASGLVGKAFEFNGNQHFSLTPGRLLDTSSSTGFAAEGFVYLSSTCSSEAGIFSRRDAISQARWALGCRNGRLQAEIQDSVGKSTGLFTGSATLSTGRWHHIALVWDATHREARIYQDGVVVGRKSANTTGHFGGTQAVLYAGQGDFGSGHKPFRGRIDGFALHRRTLRDDEVARHALPLRQGLRHPLAHCQGPVRIMPLGDSITAATNGNGSNRFGNYRSTLFTQLRQTGYNVDFTGSVTSRFAESDLNHEGWPGIQTGQMANRVQGLLKMNPPEMVLLHLGTNALGFYGFKKTLDEIRRLDADLPVIVTTIIDRNPRHGPTHDYNSKLRAEVQRRIAAGHRLFLTEMEEALNLSEDMYDTLHPNQGGADKMATVWTESLAQVLPRCRAARPLLLAANTQSARRDQVFRFAPAVMGNPLGRFSLSSGPRGMKINPETGEVRWTPGSTGTSGFSIKVVNQLGSDQLSYRVSVR